MDPPTNVWTTTAVTALMAVGVSVALAWRWQQQIPPNHSAKKDRDEEEDTPALVALDEPRNPAVRVTSLATDKTIYGDNETTRKEAAADVPGENDDTPNINHETNAEISVQEDLQNTNFSAKDIPDFTMVLDDDDDDGDMF